MRRVPIVGARIGARDLMSGLESLFRRSAGRDLGRAFRAAHDCRHVYFTDSGTSSLCTVMVALQTDDNRREVVVPAYTAESVLHAVRTAGLRPVPCDISLDDFNMNLSLLPEAVSERTLAIVGVHMFGIVAAGMASLKRRFPNVYAVEDCAQGQGGRMDGAYLGNNGDIGVFSFNCGKNLPTGGGGAIVTSSGDMAEKLGWAMNNLDLEGAFRPGLAAAAKLAAISVAFRPQAYGVLWRLAAPFRERPTRASFDLRRYSSLQAGVGLSLMKGLERAAEDRYLNGMRILEGLRDAEGVALPHIAENTRPAFNRMPILLEDLRRRDDIERTLWEAGIETSRMYGEPLHHMQEIGYERDAFPNATYLAEHLLTLPTHPLLADEDVDRMVETVRACS